MNGRALASSGDSQSVEDRFSAGGPNSQGCQFLGTGDDRSRGPRCGVPPEYRLHAGDVSRSSGTATCTSTAEGCVDVLLNIRPRGGGPLVHVCQGEVRQVVG